MPTEFLCFGEILWDCLPSGRHAGGAPFNVAAHLTQLGRSARLLSSVGRDELGDEILQVAHDKGVDIGAVTRARPDLPTGTVLVTVDSNGNATYEIVEPVAWDEIAISDETLRAGVGAQGIVFGSLAARSDHNLGALHKILAIPGPLRFFDVNLRPPFADPSLVIELARQADVLKLNDDELGSLARFIGNGRATAQELGSDEEIAEACAALARATNTEQICVTRGARGAALWQRGQLLTASAPEVSVRDTVGAGDSFMAGLMVGLTSGMDPQAILTSACRIGAFVASHYGATPLLPTELKRLFEGGGACTQAGGMLHG